MSNPVDYYPLIMAAADFEQARRRANRRSFFRALLRRRNTLCVFEDVIGNEIGFAQRNRGVMSIPIKAIVGTVSRSDDFDRAFMPRGDHLFGRWQRIASAYYLGETLPPIEVYQVGKFYYVIDGHHRVSVALTQQQMYIDAQVIEVLLTEKHRATRTIEMCAAAG